MEPENQQTRRRWFSTHIVISADHEDAGNERQKPRQLRRTHTAAVGRRRTIRPEQRTETRWIGQRFSLGTRATPFRGIGGRTDDLNPEGTRGYYTRARNLARLRGATGVEPAGLVEPGITGSRLSIFSFAISFSVHFLLFVLLLKRKKNRERIRSVEIRTESPRGIGDFPAD